MFKKLYILLFMAACFAHFTPTYACSGGRAYTMSEMASEADIIVQGKMDMVDERGQNGVMKVETVFSKSDVPQYILLDFAPSGFIYSVQDRFSGGGCFYGVPPLDTEQTIFTFLKKMPNGAYRRSLSNSVYYTFPTKDSTVPVYSELPASSTPNASQPTPIPQYQEHDADSTTFPQLITAAVGQPPHPPQLNSIYPLPTSLYIRTVKGTEYELPVDIFPPKRLDITLADENGNTSRTSCIVINCIGSSPNGVDTAQVMPDGTIQILSFVGSSVPGNAFQFSTTSDAFAVWDTNQITIYALPYNRLGFCCNEITQINNFTITNTASNKTQVAWSPDGRLVAFSDSTGLYLWDVFTFGSLPRLLATPFDTTITPRFFSRTGRYLAAQRGKHRFYIDMVNGLEIPDGVISPDDRNLLQFDTQSESPLRFYRLAPFSNFTMLGDHKKIHQAEWIDKSRFWVVDCKSSQRESCSVWFDGLTFGGGQYEGFAFDYDKLTQTLAIAMSGKRIGIFDPTRMLNTYDFSNYLDGEIETIEWMQPIFFQPNL